MENRDDLLGYNRKQRFEIEAASDDQALFLIDYLSAFGPSDTDDIAADFGLSKVQIEHLLANLTRAGLVSQSATPERHYIVSQTGLRLLKEVLRRDLQKPLMRPQLVANTVLGQSLRRALRLDI